MDIISHGLRGGISVGRKNKKQFWLSFVFGILPDLVAFGIPFAMTIGYTIISGTGFPGRQASHHNLDGAIIHNIYNMGHSVIVWTAVFGILRLIFKKPVVAAYARLFHILLDIPTHSLAFYATPFLWPISSYKFDGIPRSTPWIFFTNLTILAIVYGIYARKKYKTHP